ncbi:MAG: hypothetical protein IT410_03005 [Candidatus Doudnabacteria bacterium]|nr:hypothetical protein [Candidatus Doudnabacteria bacterium]
MKPEQIPFSFQEQPPVPQSSESKPQVPYDGMKDIGLDGQPIVWRKRTGINGNEVMVRELDEDPEVSLVAETLPDLEVSCEYCNDAPGGCSQCGFGRNQKNKK